MAFGDSGNQLVNIEGVPFRVNAPTWEEGAQQALDMLQQAPELFDQRASRLGLSEADVDALKLRFEAGGRDTPLIGEARDIETSGLDRFRIGMGHQFLRRARGVRQLYAKLFGDETAVEMIHKQQEDEDQLYRKLDEKGIGMEDLGQLSADMTAFLVPGSQGVLGGAATGAVLATADVREDQAGGEIMTDAAFGAAFGSVVPFVSRSTGAVRGVADRFGGLSLPIRANSGRALSWMRFRALRNNPGATERIVQEGLEMTAQEVNQGQRILGRAALDKIQTIINSLPKNSDMGLRDEAAMGVVRAALRESTEQVGNTNVFNPFKWEAHMGELQGMIGSVFRDTAHTQALGSINILAREMQKLGTEIPAELAERAAEALIKAPARAKPVIEAMRMATSEPVKLSFMEQLAIIAQETALDATANVVGRGPGALPRSAMEQIDQEIREGLENF